jgi:hypothetical protein
MLLKQRKVRESRFRSRMRSNSRQRQEYTATVYSMAIIQAILAATMFLAGIRAWQAVSAHGNDLPLFAKLVMPVVFIAASLMAVRACFRSVQSARDLRPRDHSRHPEPPDPS